MNLINFSFVDKLLNRIILLISYFNVHDKKEF